MKDKPVIAVFNRGIVSKLSLARQELDRIAMSAEIQTNYMPRVLGPMTLRPGLGYVGDCADDGALIPFIFSSDDTAILELTPSQMRIWVDDALLTRPAVSTTISNETFDSDVTGWTDADDSGCVSEWATGGYMKLTGTGYNSARRRFSATVSGPDSSVVHGLRIHVQRGPIVLRVGSTAGDDDVFRQAVLRTGYHSIAFVPGGNFVIEFSSAKRYPVLLSECSIEDAGVVEIPTPWTTADICRSVDFEQSNDVLFCASPVRQQRIERRDNNSWSVAEYFTDNGPFDGENTDNITLTPSAIDGEITLTASRPVFRADHVGALFRVSSQGQLVESTLSSAPTFTDSVRVVGVGTERKITIVRAGTWSGTLTLQRSIGEEGSWVDVATYTTNGTANVTDTLDNQVVFYRVGFDTGDYTSGSADVSIEFATGSITGTVLVTAYTSNVLVSGVVLRSLGGTDATEFWAEGAWSDDQGWPTAVSIWQGRLWWFKRGRVYGSVSDAYESFDEDTEGDAAPIIKGFGAKASHNPVWAAGLDMLVVGTEDAEYVVRSNALNEPVTPGNYNIRIGSAEGSYNVLPAYMKNKLAFVDRSGQSVYEMVYSRSDDAMDVDHANVLIPELFEDSNAYQMDAQRKPDERLHVVREDGTVALYVRDVVEEVKAWCNIETDGFIEDVVVLPERGQKEDAVYYRVRRTIGETTVRYLEKAARFDQCEGGALSLLADSFITGTGAVDGLDHLEGKEVVIWGDGEDRGTGTVSSGAVAGHSYTTWCAGLYYEATYKSSKLANQPRIGVMLNERSRIHKLGVVLANTHHLGLQFGPDFDNLDDLPLMEDAVLVDGDVYEDYDEDFIEFPGDWGTDSRLCLKSFAPRPCTVMSVSLWLDRQVSS